MSKSRTRFVPRFEWFRASVIPTKKRRETNADLFPGRVRLLRAIYVGAPNASTGFFAILLQFAAAAARFAIAATPSLDFK